MKSEANFETFQDYETLQDLTTPLISNSTCSDKEHFSIPNNQRYLSSRVGVAESLFRQYYLLFALLGGCCLGCFNFLMDFAAKAS